MITVNDWSQPPADVQLAVAATRQMCASWQPARIELPSTPEARATADPIEGTVCAILKDPGFLDHAAWQIAEYSGVFGFLLGVLLIGSGLHRLLLRLLALPLRIARHYWGVPKETLSR